MNLEIVKTDQQYRSYMKEIEELAANDPDPSEPEGARLELLAKLVEDYEKERYTFLLPDPIEAIKFRMSEEGLRQKDIAPLLGGKNRASEVLSRTRPLTLKMIREVHENLGIPADLLISKTDSTENLENDLSVERASLNTLISRGWISKDSTISDVIKRFLAPIGSPVYLRHTMAFGANEKTNRTRLWLWLARIKELAEIEHAGQFSKKDMCMDFLRHVAQLSCNDDGPIQAIDFLKSRGIVVVIEPKLPGTRIDGAAMMGTNNIAVIGLSLRYDRIDNFWFTLLHELAHLWQHLDSQKNRAVIDEDLENRQSLDLIEQEANEIAYEALLPRSIWRRSDAHIKADLNSVLKLSKDQNIDPAIIAGRIRFERNNYKLLPSIRGENQIRRFFPHVRWR